MTTSDLNDVLNLIKIRFRYFEWRLTMFEEVDNCVDSLIEITRELTCILNLDTITSKDKITASDYLLIVHDIIGAGQG